MSDVEFNIKILLPSQVYLQ